MLLGLALLCLAGGGVAAYLLTRPTKVVVPSVTGEQFSVAQAQLQNANFAVSQVQVTSQQKAGTRHRPGSAGGRQGQGADDGRARRCPAGPVVRPVPQVVGETLAQAKSAIEIANLKVGRVIYQSSTTIASGRVIETTPAAGDNPAVNSPVTIFVSTGPPPVRVPDVTGETVGQAKAQLEGPPGNFNGHDD